MSVVLLKKFAAPFVSFTSLSFKMASTGTLVPMKSYYPQESVYSYS
jgi:hypothetical protein